MTSASKAGRNAVVALLALTLCAQTPPQSHPSPAHTPARRITVVGVSNFGEVTPYLLRGGQPKGEGYENLKKMGVDIVVDVRLSGKDKEKKLVNQAGMKFVGIPWHCYFPRDHVFAEFLDVLRENKGKKLFVHCRYGDDRTGMMIAVYRMAVENWTPKEAREEMEKFGFHPMICPSLGPYEAHFPEHLRKSDDFRAWREKADVAQ
jgi:tyrosine-protein phosphatase SIW14